MSKKKQSAKKQTPRSHRPYRVEMDATGCSKCRAGRTWFVVCAMTEAAGATSYDDVWDAQNEADSLNEAFSYGYTEAAMDRP